MKKLDRIIIFILIWIVERLSGDPETEVVRSSSVFRIDFQIPDSPVEFLVHWILPGLFIIIVTILFCSEVAFR